MSDGARWIRGIDEPLPDGETIVWSGAPDARAVARHVFHLRVWTVYMAVLAVLVGTSAFAALSVADALKVMVLPLLAAALLLGGIILMARLTAKNSSYILTSRRLVLRAGIAVPMAINIPLRLIDEAGIRRFRDGTGELRLRLSRDVKLAYIALWPHVEAFRSLAHPLPKLRGLTNPDVVGAAFRDAIAAEAARTGDPVRLGDSRVSERDERSYAAGQEVLAR